MAAQTSSSLGPLAFLTFLGLVAAIAVAITVVFWLIAVGPLPECFGIPRFWSDVILAASCTSLLVRYLVEMWVEYDDLRDEYRESFSFAIFAAKRPRLCGFVFLLIIVIMVACLSLASVATVIVALVVVFGFVRDIWLLALAGGFCVWQFLGDLLHLRRTNEEPVT